MLWGARTARPLPCQPQKSTHSRASVESESCGMMRRGCSKITSVRRVSTAAAKEQVLTSVDNKCPTCGRSFLNLFTLLWSALLKNSVWAKPSKSEACRENPLPLSTPISWQLSLALSCSLAHSLSLSLSLSLRWVVLTAAHALDFACVPWVRHECAGPYLCALKGNNRVALKRRLCLAALPTCHLFSLTLMAEPSSMESLNRKNSRLTPATGSPRGD